MKSVINTLLILSLSISTVFANAEEEHAHGDALLVDINGTLTTGIYDVDENDGEAPVNIYEAELELFDLAGVYVGDEPGFYALSQANLDANIQAGLTTLPADTPITLSVVPLAIDNTSANFWRWNDATQQFDVVNDGTNLQIESKPGGADIFADGSDTIDAGALIGTTSATGFLHDHLEFFLNDDDANFATHAPEGVYLVTLQFSDGQRQSDPFYLLLGAIADENNDEAIEEMIEAAEEGLEAALVPSPSTGLIAGLTCIGLMMRRSRPANHNAKA